MSEQSGQGYEAEDKNARQERLISAVCRVSMPDVAVLKAAVTLSSTGTRNTSLMIMMWDKRKKKEKKRKAKQEKWND